MKYSLICLWMFASLFATTSVCAQDTVAATTPELEDTSMTAEEADHADELDEEHRAKLAFEGIRSGDLDMTKKYLFPQMVYDYDQDGENILTLAIRSGNIELINYVEQHAIINRKNKSGDTPLTLAIKEGNKEIVEIILYRAKASLKNDLGELPISLALIHNYDLKLLQRLITEGAKLDARSNGVTPLSLAVKLDNLPAVALFLKNGADASYTNGDGTLPLTVAVLNNRQDIGGLLLNNSPSPTEDANWVNELGEPLIVLAAAEGNNEMIQTLVYFGANVDATDYMDNTALLVAAKNGDTIVMEFLVQNGAMVDAQNMMGITPVMAAAESGQYAAASFLANNGANIDGRSFSGIAATDFYSFTSPATAADPDNRP
ncbi:MAG: ankyrin repeat domain-containing protein [Bacteroidota bacterium]